MSDIFNIIKSNIERTKKPKRRTSNIEDFIIGEEEKNYRSKPKKEKPAAAAIEEDPSLKEIGVEKERKNYRSRITEINFQKLDKLPAKLKVKQLTEGYIEILDLIKEMERDFLNLEDENSVKSIELHQTNREIKRYKELVRMIAGILPDGGSLKERLEVTVWQVNEIEDVLLGKLRNLAERNKNVESYIAKELEQVQNENKALKRQLVKFEAELTNIENRLGGKLPEKETAENIETKTEEKPEIEVVTEAEEKPDQPEIANETEEPEENEELKLHVLDVERYVENLSEANKVVVKMIGETGASRNSELRPLIEADIAAVQLFSRAGKFSYQDMSATVKSLRDGGFLESEQVKLGAKGGFNFTCYELSALGKAVYKNITGKVPVTPEKKLITNQHKTLEHGYLIKDCATEFKNMGYTVYDKREDVTVQLPTKGKKIFDLIIEKNGEKKYIEVERGTHNDPDFFDAMDKIHEVTNEFYFVSPNQKQLFSKTKFQFFKWINERLGGIEKAQGKIIVHFATFEDIKKGGKNVWKTTKL